MAKVTLNSDKGQSVFKVFYTMNEGEIGEIVNTNTGINSRLVKCINIDSMNRVIDLSDSRAFESSENFQVRILRPDESITLRNE